ncbi:YveK family protein [Scopulibacillus cellulosilyticus]|uniref:YveK family protein n=1 Tax=Scopulibacillus cellulosilyticus TaxID=2665665 RepID=A0ABW2PZ34_9BACL
MEETISLKEIFQTLRKRITMILVITILATAVSAFVTYFFITPKYDASTQILVNQSKDKQSVYDQNAVQTNVQLVNTYSVIIKSPKILKEVIDRLHLNMTPDDLKRNLNVNSEENSQVFTVMVEDKSPNQSEKIANTISTVFKQQIPNIMKVDNVSILSKAQLASDGNPVKPKPTLNIGIGFIVGLMISIGLAFLLEYLDNTVKNEQEMEELLELPVLGVITEMELSGRKKSKKEALKSTVRGERFEA